MAPPTLLPDAHNEMIGGGEGWLQALRCLQRLEIHLCPKFLSAYSLSSPSCRLFPSSLQHLDLYKMEGMGTLEPLSNLTSLTRLKMWSCGEDLRCEGLLPLLTTGGHLSELIVYDCPRFFAGWDPRSEMIEEEQQLQLVPHSSPSTPRELRIDEAAGFLAAPICSLLSSSLTKLWLERIEMERFSKEQEDALHLLASLQELKFYHCYNLTNLPAGLHKLTNLKQLCVYMCPAIRSLPKDGLPKSLQELDVCWYLNEELIQQCRGLLGTIPNIIILF